MCYMMTCENCDATIDEDLYEELFDTVHWDQTETEYDGVRNLIHEEWTIRCKKCSHVQTITGGWVMDPRDYDSDPDSDPED